MRAFYWIGILSGNYYLGSCSHILVVQLLQGDEMAKVGTGACPLCDGQCESLERTDTTLFRCDVCKPFRITPAAIRLLPKVAKHVRAGLREDAMVAYRKDKVLEIRVAPIGSHMRFVCTSE